MRKFQRVLLAADREGVAHLKPVVAYIEACGDQHQLIEEENDDRLYQKLASEVLKEPQNVGVLLTGSGVTANMKLNGMKGIRAALTHSNYIADMCRKHNDANVMVLPMHCLGLQLAKSLIESYLNSGFDGEVRNQKRVQKLRDLQEKYSKQP